MIKPRRNHSEDTWARARDDYLEGYTAEMVCKRYDIDLSNFRKTARKKGFRRGDMPEPPVHPLIEDLESYRTLRIDDQLDMTCLRMAQAIAEGDAMAAQRWLKMRDALSLSYSKLLAEVFDIGDLCPDPEAGYLKRADVAARKALAEQDLKAGIDAAMAEQAAADEAEVHSVHPKKSPRPQPTRNPYANRHQRRRQAKLTRPKAPP